jgi:gliding motility-associated-like protein
LIGNSYSQVFQSAVSFGNAYRQKAVKSVTDKLGNTYMAIKYDSAFTIDSSGTAILIKADSRTNITLVKLDSNLKYQWHTIIQSDGRYQEEALGFNRGGQYLELDIDNQGNVFFATNIVSHDSIQFLSSNNTIAKTFNRNQYPIYLHPISFPTDTIFEIAFLLKITPAGIINWVNFYFESTYSSSGTLRITNIKTDINNDVCVASYLGNIDSIYIADQSGLLTLLAQQNFNYTLLHKFTPLGMLVLIPQLYTNNGRVANLVKGIEIDSNNNHYYLLDFRGNDTMATTVIHGGYANMILVKTDANHNYIWSRVLSIDIWGREQPAFCLSPKGDRLYFGQSYRSGYCYSEENFYTGTPYPSNGGSDFVLQCWDNNGNKLWDQTFGGTQNDSIIAITENKDGDIFCVGVTTSSTLNFTHSQAHYTSGNCALFITVFDSTFRNKYTQSIQGTFSNMGWLLPPQITKSFKLNFAENGKGYMSGWFANSIQFPCSTLVSQGSDDAFIAIFNPLNNPIDTGVCYKMTSPSGKYIWDSTAIYYDTIPNSQGCDSVLLFNLKILTTKSIVDTNVCYNMTSPSGKFIWDSTATYVDTIPNSKGCDSLLTIHLKILTTKNTIDTNVCYSMTSPSGKYIWDSTAMYVDTIPNANRCDSLLTINLKILTTKNTIDTNVCYSMTSPSGKYIWNTTGIYNDTITNTKNCDSIITIRLFTRFTQSTWDTAACSSYASPSGKYTLFASDTITDTISNTLGCDSIITIRFIRLKVTGILDTTTCGNLISPSGKYSYSANGIYLDTITSYRGCDSIISITYTKSITQSSITKTVCDTFISPSGKYIYNATGSYIDTIPSIQQCDSIITIQLTVLPLQITLTKSNDISCDTLVAQLTATTGYSYQWNNTATLANPTSATTIALPTEKTTYTVIVNDSLGCSITDSIEVLVDKSETIKPLANVFTPNDDGLNDCLQLSSVCNFKNMSMSVFNRWGNIIFETSNPNECWSGKSANGSNVSEGVYLFILNGTSACETEIKQRGTIQLIR